MTRTELQVDERTELQVDDLTARSHGVCAGCGRAGDQREVHGRLVCEECWRTARDVFSRGVCDLCGREDVMRIFTHSGFVCRDCALKYGEILIDFGRCEGCGKPSAVDQMADERWLCSKCSMGVMCES